MNLAFRNLKADEIECRVATVNEKGCSLLLYKDSRADMILLDEVVGPTNWQRTHTRDNANCTVLIWDEEKEQWIGKEDTGKESSTEKEKGLASDSFKRACVNWGIGRELYTAPFIWISAKNVEITPVDGQSKKKYTTRDYFNVDSITYDGKKIIGLTISNAKTKKIVYIYGSQIQINSNSQKYKKIEEKTESEMLAEQEIIAKQKIGQAKINTIKSELKRTGVAEKAIYTRYKVKKLEDITEELFIRIMNALSKTKSQEVTA